MTDQQPDQSIERVRLELVTRRFMVQMLALTCVWTGIAIIATGAPSFIEGWLSPWSRYLIGGWAFTFGLIASVGGMVGDQRWRGWWTQVIGLVGLVLWYFGMGAAYVGLVLTETVQFVGPGEPLDPSVSGRGYVPLIYLGLMMMTATPLVTMLRLVRSGALGPTSNLDG